MMKVKIFTEGIGNDGSREHLEEKVDRFLKEHPLVTPQTIQVNTCAGINNEGKAFVNATITIFYQHQRKPRKLL